MGTLRALVTFFLSDWIRSPLMVLMLWGLGAAGWSRALRLANDGDTGASAAVFGTLVAAGLLLQRPWRDLLLGGIAAYLAFQYTFEALDVSIVHTLAAMVGAVIALVWLRRLRLRDINTDEFWLTHLLTWAWQSARRQA